MSSGRESLSRLARTTDAYSLSSPAVAEAEILVRLPPPEGNLRLSTTVRDPPQAQPIWWGRGITPRCYPSLRLFTVACGTVFAFTLPRLRPVVGLQAGGPDLTASAAPGRGRHFPEMDCRCSARSRQAASMHRRRRRWAQQPDS